MAAFDSLTRQFGSLEVNGSTINKDNEHAGCSQRVKEVMDEGNDKPADAPGKSLDEGLLLRKGVYPYDYVDGFEKLHETELPPSEALYNTITGERVDFEYLKELHDYHNGYSLAPETIQLNKVKNLVPNLGDKLRYVIHYVNLKTVLALRLKIRKPHGYKFKPDSMAEDLNRSNHRAQSRCHHLLFQAHEQCGVGKTIENIRKRVDVRMVTNEKKVMKLVTKLNFDRRVNFSEYLAAMHMRKTK
ncbi:unnamed protein product [Mytilus edulis]|uniref:Uncharacterized protein n=1 Tax=Mytilus edulis TaxID=6550 RepID=A0A8S3T5Q4_MYTED|nr:unnamed protein product [Mytilus edulis]